MWDDYGIIESHRSEEGSNNVPFHYCGTINTFGMHLMIILKRQAVITLDCESTNASFIRWLSDQKSVDTMCCIV